MSLSDKLKALEHALAELQETVNRVALLNHALRELTIPPVAMPQLGMLWHQLEEAQFDVECELSRRACVGVTA
jgi:hypothetical protein